MLIVRIGAVVFKPITVADIIRYDVVPFQMTLDFMWIEKRTQEELITSNLSIFAKGQFEGGKLGFAAQFRHPSNNDSGRIAVMIFRGKDIAAVRKTLEANELMREELITFQAFPQYLAKGALGE